MAMKGFNPKWKDLPDYILGITKEIWEDRGVATLHHYYGRDMIKRGSGGVVIGAQVFGVLKHHTNRQPAAARLTQHPHAAQRRRRDHQQKHRAQSYTHRLHGGIVGRISNRGSNAMTVYAKVRSGAKDTKAKQTSRSSCSSSLLRVRGSDPVFVRVIFEHSIVLATKTGSDPFVVH